MPHEIVDLLIAEVSLVDDPANERPFLLIKNRTGDTTVADNQLIELALGTDLENEEAIDKKIGSLPSDSQEALKGALRILQAHRENITSDVLKSLASEMGVEFQAEKQEGGGDPPKDKDEGAGDTSKLQPEVAAILQALQKSNSTLEERLQKSDAKVAELDRARRKDDMIVKVKDLRLAKAEPDKLADALLSLQDSSPEAYEQLSEILTATSAVVEGSDLLKAIGSDTAGDASETVYEKVAKAAKKMVEDSNGKLSFANAQDTILKNDRDLAKLYSEEIR